MSNHSLRILLVLGSSPFGTRPNFETAITGPLLSELRGRDLSVTCVCPSGLEEGAGPMLEPTQNGSVRVVPVQPVPKIAPFATAVARGWPPSACRMRRTWSKAFQGEVQRAVDELNPHIVHVMSPVAALILSGWRGRGMIYSSIDSLRLGLRNGALGRDKRLSGVLRRWSQARMDADLCSDKERLVFVSRRDAEYAKSYFNGRIDAIPIGCDLRRFPVKAIYKAQRPRMVFVGSPEYQPNAEALKILLLKIWPCIEKRGLGAEVLIIGRGVPRFVAALKAQTPSVSLEGVIAKDFAPDLNAELSTAQVATYPLVSGSGMKNKVLDALCVGLPVVAFPEALSGHDSLPGAIACNDVASFVDQVGRLMSSRHLWEETATDALKTSQILSWPRVVDKYVELWADHTKRKGAND